MQMQNYKNYLIYGKQKLFNISQFVELACFHKIKWCKLSFSNKSVKM
jgi:hypothetical protein